MSGMGCRITYKIADGMACACFGNDIARFLILF